MPLDGSHFVRSDLNNVTYSAVETTDAVAQQLGLPLDSLERNSILKVNANENAYGPHPKVTAATATACQSGVLHIYPDPDGPRVLRERIAKEFGPKGDATGVDRVVVGAGSDDVLEVMLRVTGANRVVISTPTFGMYAFLAKQYNSSVVDVPRMPERDFAVDIDGIKRVLEKDNSGVSIVFLTSPNNPTATLTPMSEIEALCAFAADKNTIVCVDEAYIEFVEHEVRSATELLLRHTNLAVVRTFSKWAGLAGVRAGYVMCAPGLAEAMRACRQPYHFNAVAQVAAMESLKQRGEIMLTVRALYDTTKQMLSDLSGPEFSSFLRPVPGARANFVLCEVLDRPARSLFEDLRSVGVMTRYFGTQGGSLECHVRISAPTEAGYPRLMRALRAARDGKISLAAERARVVIAANRPKAVLFDMDGVLSDVSSSYRRAITLAARRFGVDVTQDDIVRIKAQGDANNDWVIAHRLVCEKWNKSSPEPKFEEIKDAFEEIYQGTENCDGLWKSERLIVPKAALEKLAAIMPLGIVTGRPRNPDCERFLDQHGIKHLFSTIVTLDDTSERKPAPDPVLLALSNLGNPGVSVFLGDTIDDINAARAARRNVIPVGVLLHSTRASTSELQVLENAGAAGVVSPGCAELFEAFEPDVLGATPAADKPGFAPPARGGSGSSAGTPRSATLTRSTLETSISVTVNIDGKGTANVSTGVGFFDHMLSALAKHSRIDLDLKCSGDLHIDDHHTVEDVSITLGRCIKEAIGERKSIKRYGSAFAPLDDALARAVVDVSSRPYAQVKLCFTRESIGNMSTEMLEHAMESLITAADLTVHVDVLTPEANNHHKAESAFKALALAFRQAFARDESAGVPSTKGML
jgi:imidazoleglycerol-phosphate dehydratase